MKQLFRLILMMAVFHSSSAEIIIDGKLNDDPWVDSQLFEEFKVSSPNTGAQPVYKTHSKLYTNKQGIYVGFINEQPIEKRSRKYSSHDQFTLSDFNTFVIDFSGDHTEAYEFTATLGGGFIDGVYFNSNTYSDDWDGFWTFATSEDDEHWYTEIFIPWSSVPFKEQELNIDNINVYFRRYNIDQLEAYSFPGFPSSDPQFVQLMHPVELNKPNSSSLSITPYIAPSQDNNNNKRQVNLGADLIWKPSSNKQLTMALNPDFGNTEADDLIFNYSAIEVLPSENRPFFTENQSLFEIGNSRFQMLNTRRIGNLSPGESLLDTQINVAGKFFYKGRNTDLGVMVVDESSSQVAQGNDFLSMRWLSKKENYRVGQIVNSFYNPNINQNDMSTALDLQIWKDKFTMNSSLMYSSVKSNESQNGLAFELSGIYQVNRRQNHSLSFFYYDDEINLNGMGFLQRNNFKGFTSSSNWLLDIDSSDKWSHAQINVESYFAKNGEGHQLPNQVNLSGSLVSSLNHTYTFNYGFISSGEDDLIIGNGELFRTTKRNTFGLSYSSPFNKKLNWSAKYNYFQEGENRWASQYSIDARYYFTDQIFIVADTALVDSNDWVIADLFDNVLSYKRRFHRVGLDFQFRFFDNQEISVKSQWLKLNAKNGQLLYDNLLSDDSALSLYDTRLATQIRYRYQIDPFSVFFVTYVRNGSAFLMNDYEGSTNTSINQLWSNPNDDLLFIKYKKRF